MRSSAAAVFLGIAWAGVVLGGPARAEADLCTIQQRGCLAQCDKTYPASREDAGHAGCLARCSWDAVSCATQHALDDTRAAVDRDLKPFLADQAGKWQRFLDGFRRGGQGGTADPPSSRPTPDAPPAFPHGGPTTPL